LNKSHLREVWSTVLLPMILQSPSAALLWNAIPDYFYIIRNRKQKVEENEDKKE